MRHGYTNHTIGNASSVKKTYQGPDSHLRLAREREILRLLHGRMPVPEIYASRPDELTLQFLPGTHGQDLIEQGHARPVLRACGRLLRALHDLSVTGLGLHASPGQVLVHGDFGPNNVLLDPATFTVTALLDWEFAHVGDPIEDLAWCEWIIRAHHREHRDALEEFFVGYDGDVPAWPERRAAMTTRCGQLQKFCQQREPHGPGRRCGLSAPPPRHGGRSNPRTARLGRAESLRVLGNLFIMVEASTVP